MDGHRLFVFFILFVWGNCERWREMTNAEAQMTKSGESRDYQVNW